MRPFPACFIALWIALWFAGLAPNAWPVPESLAQEARREGSVPSPRASPGATEAGSAAANLPASADRPFQRPEIQWIDAGADRLVSPAPELSAQAAVADRERYLRETVFPKIEAEAAAGVEPSAYEIGFYHLNGWGTPVDLDKAEVAFRRGLRVGKGHGAWRLSYVIWQGAQSQANLTGPEREARYRKAEELLLASVAAGFKRAVPQVAYFAQELLFGWYGRRVDYERAEALLDKAGALDARHRRPRCVRMQLRFLQNRFEEAFDLAGELLAEERQWATQKDLQSVGWQAVLYRVGCGIHLRRTEALSPELVGKALDHPHFEMNLNRGYDLATLRSLEALAREHPRFLHQLALLRFKEWRFGEAFELEGKAAPRLRSEAVFHQIYVDGLFLRSLTALLAGRANEVPLDELKALSKEDRHHWTERHMSELRAVCIGIILGGILVGALTALAVALIWWKKPGLLRALLCAGVAEVALGIPLGIQVLFKQAGHLSAGGSNPNVLFLVGALAGLLCTILAARSVDRSLFGSWRWPLGERGAVREGALILGLIASVFAFDALYSLAFETIMGRPLPSQDILSYLRLNSLRDLDLVLLGGALLVPWMEELIFRGLLWEPIQERWGRNWAWVLTSAGFAVLHGWTFALPTLLLGFLLGWLRLRHRGIGPSVCVHALNNAIALTGVFLTKAGPGA